MAMMPLAHQRRRFPYADQERLGLGVQREIPLLERDLHGRSVEARSFSASVAHENVELAEFRLDAAEHAADVLRLAYIRLHNETVASALPHLGQCVARGFFVAEVVDGDLNAVLRQL
jgi:hypothetical protein